jgi:hypothetical protein
MNVKNTTVDYHNPGTSRTLDAAFLRQGGPTEEHIGVYRTWARLATNEELHAGRDDARWLLSADDDDYPADVCERSRLNNLAIIAAVNRELDYRSRRGLSRPHVRTGIPREFLDELKARIAIEQEIGDSLFRAPKRSGNIYLALCPFHEDHHPSLVIWPKSGRWRCYPCDLGGDVFAWVQAHGKMTFREAVVYLSARAGVDLPAELRAPGA